MSAFPSGRNRYGTRSGEADDLKFDDRDRRPIRRDGLHFELPGALLLGIHDESAVGRPDRIERKRVEQPNRLAAVHRDLEQTGAFSPIGGDGHPLAIRGPGGGAAHVEGVCCQRADVRAVGIHDVQASRALFAIRKADLTTVR